MITANYMAPRYEFRAEYLTDDYTYHGFGIEPLDAPESISAGSHVWVDYLSIPGGTWLPSVVTREWQ